MAADASPYERTHDFHPDEMRWPVSRRESFPTRPWEPMVRVADYVMHLPHEVNDPEVASPWDDSQWRGPWLWGEGGIGARECHFWFVALTTPERHTDTREAHTSASALRRRRYTPYIELDEARDRMRAWFDACMAIPARARYFPHTYLVRLLEPLLPAHELLDVLFEVVPTEEVRPFVEFLVPPEGDEEAMSALVASASRHLAALDLSEEWAQFTAVKLLERVDVPEQRARLVSALSAHPVSPQSAHRAALALIESEDEFVAAFDAFDVSVGPGDVALYYGRGGWRTCDALFERARRAPRGLHSALFERLMRIHGPEACQGMLRFAEKTQVARAARAWLLEEGEVAAAGLAPLALSYSDPRESIALDVLREMFSRGKEELLEDAFAHLDARSRDSLERLVFARDERPSVEWPPEDWDAWASSIASDSLSRRTPEFVRLDELPRLTSAGGYVVPDAVTMGVLDRLLGLGNAVEDEVMPKVREGLDPTSASAFASALFDAWLDAGAPAKHKYCLYALGWLGDEAANDRLAQLAEEWPRSNHIARARWALDALRIRGTDSSLQTISDIARSARSQGFRAAASRTIDAIAARRGLTVAELEDRIVPTCGLDAFGRASLDLGSRTFEIVLGPDLRAMLRDADGGTSTRFPSGRSGDDPEKVQIARRRWKATRTELSKVARAQTARLEEAMCSGRTWRGSDFVEHLAAHALLTLLVQRLVWVLERPRDGSRVLFRVTDDRALFDAGDDAVPVGEDDVVSLLHPLHASESELSAWQRMLADDEIVQPFEQLERPVLSVDDALLEERLLDVFDVEDVSPGELLGWSRRHGWSRGAPQDNGTVWWHYRVWPGGVVSYVGLDPGYNIESPERYGGPQLVGPIEFRAGDSEGFPGLGSHAAREPALRLERVDPLVLSETLLALSRLGSSTE